MFFISQHILVLVCHLSNEVGLKTFRPQRKCASRYKVPKKVRRYLPDRVCKTPPSILKQQPIKSKIPSNSTNISHPIVCLSRRETFSASHRLHNPDLSDEENRQIYSKCNNPNGHGHNYVVYAVMKGPVEEKTGMVYNIADLKRDLGKILDTLDHKNLDLDVEFFRYYRNTLLKNR